MSAHSAAPTGHYSPSLRPPALCFRGTLAVPEPSQHLLLPIASQVLAVKERHIDIVLTDQARQHVVAFKLRQRAQITVTPKKVESVIDEPRLCLQRRRL